MAGLELVTCSVMGIGVRTTRAVTGCTYQIYKIDIKTALVAIVRTGTVLLPQKGFLCYTFYASESAVGAKVQGISRSCCKNEESQRKDKSTQKNSCKKIVACFAAMISPFILELFCGEIMQNNALLLALFYHFFNKKKYRLV